MDQIIPNILIAISKCVRNLFLMIFSAHYCSV